MYKMIAIDLDGTLLDDGKEVLQENIDMINKAYAEKGVISVVTTGRSYKVAEYIARKIGDNFSQYIISANGSKVRDNKKSIDIRNEKITVDGTLKIFEIANKYNFRYSLDIEEILLLSKRRVNDEAYRILGQPYRLIEGDILEYINTNKVTPAVISLMGDEKDLLEAMNEINKIDNIKTTEICGYTKRGINGIEKGTYIDIMVEGCNKETGIKILAEYLGINKEEIIAIGDGGNDLPMFEVAGLKVAMENARDVLKQKADYITANNNEAGVAKAIKKIIFE